MKERKEPDTSIGFSECYIDKAGKKYPNIYLLEKPYTNNDGTWLPGWYFSDGTECLNGPFGTLEVTLDIMKEWYDFEVGS